MRFLLVSILFPTALSLTAQEAEKTVPMKQDTNTVVSALKTGEVQLHARYFFCNTINEGARKGHWAFKQPTVEVITPIVLEVKKAPTEVKVEPTEAK